jgi:hypothetical protein
MPFRFEPDIEAWDALLHRHEHLELKRDTKLYQTRKCIQKDSAFAAQ